MATKTGFCEKAYKTDRIWRDKKGNDHDTYEAIIDGEKVGFFTDHRILDYINKEVTFEREEKGNFINGKLPAPEGEKKQWSGGFKGKSPENTLMEVIGKSVNTALMESRAFACNWINPANTKEDHVRAIQTIQDAMFGIMVKQAIDGIKDMRKALKEEEVK